MSAIEFKQGRVIEALEERIVSGQYQDMLPPTTALAAEFQVNLKTMNKAIARLVDKGLLLRKQGHGTYIRQELANVETTLIELDFLGFSDISSHPFYAEIWRGIVTALQDTPYKLVLNVLEEDREQSGLKKVCRSLIPCAGRLLLGTDHPGQLAVLKKTREPFVLLAANAADPEVCSIYAETGPGIKAAVSALVGRNLTEIAYIGMTKDPASRLDLDKFHAYLEAIQHAGLSLSGDLIEHTPPFTDRGLTAMKNILSRCRPQAVIVAYDHLCPGVYQAIRDAGLSIPHDIGVIGYDDLGLHLEPALSSLAVPRFEIGRQGTETLLEMIRHTTRRRPESKVLTTELMLRGSVPGRE